MAPAPLTRRDHPRVCGEHTTSHVKVPLPLGSSPRMRGARRGHLWRRLVGWIIPAYAGSTEDDSEVAYAKQDHPRVCGEHPEITMHTWCVSGSSPRMRGARVEVVAVEYRRGIIPAYAGSTGRSPNAGSGPRDHPRVCGEHAPMTALPKSTTGSSPRMRGAPMRRTSYLPPPRIIPAYAGSTRIRFRRTVCSRDHPRVCGEHLIWGGC